MDSKQLLAYLEKLENAPALMVNGNTYTLEQVKLAQRISADIAAELGFQPSKPKLSRRRAFIVILEELYFDVSKYPKGVTLEKIHKRASLRFEFAFRGLKSYKTPNDIHPKNPCAYYESDGYGKARYRSALSLLVQFSDTYFEVTEAVTSLENTYNEILLC